MTSQCWKKILPGDGPADSDDTSASAGSGAMSPKKTFAPDLTSSVAVAAPMPVAALNRGLATVVGWLKTWGESYPVITTFFPFRLANACSSGMNSAIAHTDQLLSDAVRQVIALTRIDAVV